MSLGLVSPILNRGVRSRWVSTLPAGSKMLTIDAAGDVSYTDIPTAAWGSITGTLSSQTDLQNALNAKLSLTGGTVTGQLTNALGTITASTPLTLTQTWNNAAVTFTGALVNVTDTASNGSSLLMDLQVGGDTRAKIEKAGDIFAKRAFTFTGQVSFLRPVFNGDFLMANSASGTGTFFFNHNDGRISLRATHAYSWSSTGDPTAATDLFLFRDAAQILAQRNSTNAQTFRVYNTYTDASNYERGKIEWSSNVLRIGTEKAGTGSARALELQTDGTTRLTVGATGDVTVSRGVTASSLGFTSSDSGVSVGLYSNFASSNPGIGTITNHQFCVYTNAAKRLEVAANGSALNFSDALHIAVGTTTGTKIGTATTQKIGFYNATPVVQPAAVADATDAASVITQLNLLLSRMRDLGLIAT